jgi:hypothetical protein
MSTRGIVAVGLFAAAVTQVSPAFGQGNPNTPQPGGASTDVPIRTPPAADQPLVRQIPRPSFVIDGGAGVLGYIGGTGRVGPAWNVRVTADFTPRFAGEASYVGAANARSDNSGTLVYTSVDARVRYNILRADEAPVQPYVAAGVGYVGWFGPGGSPAGLVLPVALGVERMLTEHVKVGARLDVRPSFFDDLGYGNEKSPPGGDTWSLVANLGGAF